MGVDQPQSPREKHHKPTRHVLQQQTAACSLPHTKTISMSMLQSSKIPDKFFNSTVSIHWLVCMWRISFCSPLSKTAGSVKHATVTEQLKNVRSHREMGATMLEQEGQLIKWNILFMKRNMNFVYLPANNKCTLRNVHSATIIIPSAIYVSGYLGWSLEHRHNSYSSLEGIMTWLLLQRRRKSV